MTTVLELAAVVLLCGFVWFIWPPLVLAVVAVFLGLVAWRQEASK